ncbi:dihydroorotate dehydrogenase (fumarate) [Methylacidimicrobium cyclopophantes]|uniref:Dihydroorotate dehydrogenase (Fumarate) n=1 Tax=Methylacidimicrobium cyclopophantes TaxID=1041766 RepID=A0A5E6MHM1_9BACT|nr:dihydroorotate dehydrogenase-like protein [Methylacidimicrobium cyclopophantes]VVM05515.1 dihydroorotate dehydrogenase (fumarate) [Methylacidimicrobium cyclopophantes]
MSNLETRYLGLALRSPLVASSSPLTGSLTKVQEMEAAGIGAVVLPSLFEEQLLKEEVASHSYQDYGGTLEAFPKLEEFRFSARAYLDHIRALKASVGIPVIASLNGASPGWWTRYAKVIEEAGADALELNIYAVPTDPDKPGSEIEMETLDIVRLVRAQIGIPLAVKLSPFYTNFAHMAKRLHAAGANGAVLFNRFYQPDIDAERLTLQSGLLPGSSRDTRIPLTWIGILYGRVALDLAATGGVMETEDVLKVILAGAHAAMLCSSLLERGIAHVRVLREGMGQWMERHGYDAIDQWRGLLSQKNCSDPENFERAQYVAAVSSGGI